MDSTQQSIALTSLSAINYWFSRVPTYQGLAILTPTTTTVRISNNTLTLSPTIVPHGVVFYEIINAKLK